MPRRYTLTKRGEAKAATKARIVAAAVRLYREVGMAAATVPAIARAADVAPGTVRNHFPDPLDLATAAADAVLTGLELPDASMFEGLTSATERVRRLAVELAAFFERGTEWWEIRQRDANLAQAWSGPEARYRERLMELVRAAVAPLDADPAVVPTVATIVEALYFTLRGSGLSSAAAVETGLDLLLPWLEDRAG